LSENEIDLIILRLIKGRSIKPAAFLFSFIKLPRVFSCRSLLAINFLLQIFCRLAKEQAHGSFTRLFFGSAYLGYYTANDSMEQR